MKPFLKILSCTLVVAFTVTTLVPPSYAEHQSIVRQNTRAQERGELSNVSPELSKQISPQSRFEATGVSPTSTSPVGILLLKAAVWFFVIGPMLLVTACPGKLPQNQQQQDKPVAQKIILYSAQKQKLTAIINAPGTLPFMKEFARSVLQKSETEVQSPAYLLLKWALDSTAPRFEFKSDPKTTQSFPAGPLATSLLGNIATNEETISAAIALIMAESESLEIHKKAASVLINMARENPKVAALVVAAATEALVVAKDAASQELLSGVIAFSRRKDGRANLLFLPFVITLGIAMLTPSYAYAGIASGIIDFAKEHKVISAIVIIVVLGIMGGISETLQKKRLLEKRRLKVPPQISDVTIRNLLEATNQHQSRRICLNLITSRNEEVVSVINKLLNISLNNSLSAELRQKAADELNNLREILKREGEVHIEGITFERKSLRFWYTALEGEIRGFFIKDPPQVKIKDLLKIVPTALFFGTIFGILLFGWEPGYELVFWPGIHIPYGSGGYYFLRYFLGIPFTCGAIMVVLFYLPIYVPISLFLISRDGTRINNLNTFIIRATPHQLGELIKKLHDARFGYSYSKRPVEVRPALSMLKTSQHGANPEDKALIIKTIAILAARPDAAKESFPMAHDEIGWSAHYEFNLSGLRNKPHRDMSGEERLRAKLLLKPSALALLSMMLLDENIPFEKFKPLIPYVTELIQDDAELPEVKITAVYLLGKLATRNDAQYEPFRETFKVLADIFNAKNPTIPRMELGYALYNIVGLYDKSKNETAAQTPATRHENPATFTSDAPLKPLRVPALVPAGKPALPISENATDPARRSG